MKQHTISDKNTGFVTLRNNTDDGIREAINALAVYESSGLTPDQVVAAEVAMRAALGLACSAQAAKEIEKFIPKERLQEAALLLQKKDAGLLIESPCKIGDEVWCIIHRSGKLVHDRISDMDIWSMRDGIKIRLQLEKYNDYVVGIIGEGIYLSEEAALAAQKERGV